MKHFKSFTMLAIALLFLQSCEKTEPDPINVISVDQDFEVFPTQKIGEGGLELYLSIQAMQEDSCLNSVLDAEMSIVGSKIIVQINGIVEPEFCDEGLHTPKLDLLLPHDNMVYEIEFLKADLLSTSGTLSISENEIDLDIENLGGVYVMESLMYLIQKEYVWGYFIEDPASIGTGDPINFDEVVSEFISWVPDYMDLPEGNYGYFKVDASGEILIAGVKEDAVTVAFEVPDAMYWQRVVEAIDLVAKFRPDLRYSFALGDGEVYSNI